VPQVRETRTTDIPRWRYCGSTDDIHRRANERAVTEDAHCPAINRAPRQSVHKGEFKSHTPWVFFLLTGITGRAPKTTCKKGDRDDAREKASGVQCRQSHWGSGGSNGGD